MTRPVVPAEKDKAMSLEQRVRRVGSMCGCRDCAARVERVIHEVRESIARDIEASGLIYGERGIRAHFAAIARNGAST